MEMGGDCLGNRLWKWEATVWATSWATVYGNGRRLFGQPVGQPFMEMGGDCLGNQLGNRLWKWEATV